MATIRSQMVLNDGISGVLKKIIKALDTTLNAFEQVQRASGNAVNVEEIQAARVALVQAANGAEEMADAYKRAAKEEEKLNQGIQTGATAADKMLGKITAAVAAYASVSKITSLITDGLEAVDTKIGVQVQLSTVMDNVGTGDYYDEVLEKASEIQSKGIYSDDVMLAGAAELATYFSDAEALISMMDTLSNYAMGMSGGGELDTTAMVDYATGIGKIMTGSYDAMTKKGFEFSDVQKSIIEGTASEAEIVAELGTDYLGLSQDMQAAAVIADVIDESWAGLYETMSSTPEGQIISFNNSLGNLQETIGLGVYPAVLNLVNMFQENLPQIQSAAEGLAAGLSAILNVLSVIIEAAISFGTAVADNWSWIEPIIWGVVAALIAYNAVQGIGWLTTLKDIAAKGAHAVASAAQTAALIAMTAAQQGLNAAMQLCPITWIVVGIIALIAAITALIRYFDVFGAQSTSILGTLAGMVNVVIQFFVNLGLTVANIGLGIWNVLKAVCSNIGTAFHNVIANVQGWFYNLLSTVLNVVAGIAEALNKIPFVSFDYSGIVSKAEEYAAKSAEAYGSVEEYTSLADAWSEGASTFDAFSEGWAEDAFAAGAAWGDGISNSIGGLFDTEALDIKDYTGDTSGAATGFTLDDIANDTGNIANSASGIADSLDISNEELSYLRDIAERDAINRFTTAEVKIDMTGMQNRIEGGADLDGVISTLTDGFTEALLTAAEGVHA